MVSSSHDSHSRISSNPNRIVITELCGSRLGVIFKKKKKHYISFTRALLFIAETTWPNPYRGTAGPGRGVVYAVRVTWHRWELHLRAAASRRRAALHPRGRVGSRSLCPPAPDGKKKKKNQEINRDEFKWSIEIYRGNGAFRSVFDNNVTFRTRSNCPCPFIGGFLKLYLPEHRW